MVTMVYASSFLVALYATTFNYIIFIHIFHDFQDKMVWMSWMMAVQGWILPGVILLFSNIAYLVTLWLNERQNKKSGLVAPSGSFLNKGAIHPWAGGCGRKAQQSPGEE